MSLKTVVRITVLGTRVTEHKHNTPFYKQRGLIYIIYGWKLIPWTL